MMKQTLKGARGPLVPLSILVFASLLLYSIWDTSDTFNLPLSIVLAVLYICVLLGVMHFLFSSYEYIIIGQELIIRISLKGFYEHRIVIPFDSIIAIGSGEKISKMAHNGLIYNCCAYAIGRGIRYKYILYKKEEKVQKLRFRPSAQMTSYIEEKLSGKYFVH